MKSEDKFLNFFGDSQDYTFHNPLPNPFGLRGNPDTQANSVDQGDGLNGTAAYNSFTGEVQDDAWSNHPGFISGLFGGGDNDTTTVDGGELPPVDLGTVPSTEESSSGGGFISGIFGGDGMRTYHTCQNGMPISQQFPRGQQPAGWTSSSRNTCLSQSQIDARKQNTWSKIGNIFDSINKGFSTGVNMTKPGVQAPQFDPNANVNAGTTTTTTQASLGGDGTTKIIGWVLVAGVVATLGYMAIKASAPKPEFYND